MSVPKEDVRVFYEVFMLGVYSRLSIKSGDNILDAGAGVGDFSILTALANPDSTVVALEPDPSYFQILLRNVKRNSVGNCIPLCYALSSATGTETIGFGNTRKTSPRSVRTATFDDILRAQSLDAFEVVKMDIEGMEERVFRDTSWLSRTRQLAIETHWTTYRAIAGALREAGFKLSTLDARQMGRNILSFILKHPTDLMRWENVTNGFATRRVLKYLLNHAPLDVMGSKGSALRIIYAEKMS